MVLVLHYSMSIALLAKRQQQVPAISYQQSAISATNVTPAGSLRA